MAAEEAKGKVKADKDRAAGGKQRSSSSSSSNGVQKPDPSVTQFCFQVRV
jgi:hypothetical protein